MNINDRTINAAQYFRFPATQQEGETLQYAINYASILQTSEISTSTWEASTASVANPSNTTTSATAKITASPGRHEITNTITTTIGETHKRVIALAVKRNCDYVEGDYA
jgi:hypothetical protein